MYLFIAVNPVTKCFPGGTWNKWNLANQKTQRERGRDRQTDTAKRTTYIFSVSLPLSLFVYIFSLLFSFSLLFFSFPSLVFLPLSLFSFRSLFPSFFLSFYPFLFYVYLFLFLFTFSLSLSQTLVLQTSFTTTDSQ